MNEHFDRPTSPEALREKIIGLGDRSIRKSYYPELRQRLSELERFRTLLDQSNDIIFLMSAPSAKLIDANESASRQLSYEPHELLSRSFHDIADRPIPAPLQRLLEQGQEGDNETLDTLLCRKDGGRFPVEITVKLVMFENSLYAVAAARDITERKRAELALTESEAKYHGLFRTIADGVYRTDREDRFALINPAGARIFGFATPEEMIGRPVVDFWADSGDRDVFLSELRQKKSVSLYHIRTRNRSGDIIYLEITSNILEDENGRFLGTEGVLRDVTERRKLEEQLRQAQKMEAVGELAGGVAHDFNNILSAIVGYAHLAHMKMGEGDPLRYNLDRILESSQRAAALTQGLLAFSRKQPVNLAPVDVNELLMRFEKFIRRLIREDIELRTVCFEGVLPVLADAGQIEQVIMNLVTNARDAMPQGGSLTFETRPVDLDDVFVKTHGGGKAGEYALISVTDTGVGMDAKTLQKIFEPFFTTKEIGQGTGLGLAMAYGIVKTNKGFIDVFSKPDRGTTFKMYLPIRRAEVRTEAREPEEQKIKGGTEIILVAEDDGDLRKLATTILTHFGYTVIEAMDGEDAVRKFIENQDRIQLVILDCIMPGKNGKEVYDEIRTLQPGMKAVFVSGYSEDIFTKSGIPLAAAFIQKPMRPDDLLSRVRDVLDQ